MELGEVGGEVVLHHRDITAPTVTVTSDASEPVSGPFSITVTFSEPVSGLELADLVVGNDTAWNRGRGGTGQRRQPERGGRPVLDSSRS